ncbi:MAG: XRE family transcriptional regulator [Lachnospiraceae bacterium]|nr:XRE family transcriptional regulator [Lachnospiraceae bacterium]
MGKRSTKENKNIYQLAREDMELTRDKASELLSYISADRIEKIESEKSAPHPDEILAMGECYKRPDLANYYCSHECPIGQKYVPEVELKDLSQIVLEMLSTLNTIEKQRNRLIDITVDGEITEDEVSDFVSIQDTLNKISLSVDSLQLWVQNQIAQGNIDSNSILSTYNK